MLHRALFDLLGVWLLFNLTFSFSLKIILNLFFLFKNVDLTLTMPFYLFFTFPHAFFTGGSSFNFFLLLFFFRGLAFTCKALQNMQSDTTSELHVCFKRSYDEVLRHHHSFIIRSVVSVSWLFPWHERHEINNSFIGLSTLIVITLCWLALFHFMVSSHPGIWITSFFSPGSWSYIMPDYSINRGPITHLTLSSMTNCLPCWLIPINEWNGK